MNYRPSPLYGDSTSTTTHFDVNGDADGLCALHELRLAMPKVQ